MKKSIFFATFMLATPALAQECTTLCDAENWVMPGTGFIATATANGADVNALDAMGTPPIIHAVRFGNPAQLSAIIAAGADVNIQTANGSTPLLHAITLNKFRQIVALIEAGADVNIQNNEGNTLLHHMAKQVVPLELFPFVMAAEPDLTLQDNQGQTAYDHALMNEVTGSQVAPLLNPATP